MDFAAGNNGTFDHGYHHGTDMTWRLLPFLILIASTGVRAQSFQCTSGLNKVEQLICDDKSLGNLDVMLAKQYKTLLAQHPNEKAAILADQRKWLKIRDENCATGESDTMIQNCIKDLYAQRLSSIRDPHFVDSARKSQELAMSCQKIADRYKPLAHTHRGEWLLQVLSTSTASGFVMDMGPGISIDNATELATFGAAQHPPFTISTELKESLETDVGNWNGQLSRAPGLEFYMFSQSEGNLGCYNRHFMYIRNGVAELAPPPVPQPDPDDDCNRKSGGLATLDGVPIYVEASFDNESVKTAGIDVSTWRGEEFKPACEAYFTYRTWFSDKTTNNWGESCEISGCNDARRAAFKLAEDSYQDFDNYKTQALARLTADQRTQYDEMEKVAGDAHDEEVNEGSRQLPYLIDGRVYVVSIGSFTIGWRVYSDLRVKFQSIKEGKLHTDAAFAVGVSAGDIDSVTVTPMSIEATQ